MAVRILSHPVRADDLAGRLAAELTMPVSVVTMGSPWRGDDAAAIEVGRRLQGRAALRLFNVETAPESYLMPIARCGAASCVLVDALDAGADPGDVVLLAPEDLQHTDFTTHGLSPKAFLRALGELSGMTLVVLGIQVGGVRDGEVLSGPVARAADTVATALTALYATETTGGADEPTSAAGRRSEPDPHGT